MPWNQPGNSSGSGSGNGSKRPQNPWGSGGGGGGRDQGPPDLDEMLKDLMNRFRLGGSRRGGQGDNGSDQPPAGGSRVPGMGMMLLLGLVALGFWLFSGFYKINEGEQGVEMRFGEYSRTTEAGLHWHFPSPIETVHTINVSQVNTVEVGYRSRGRSNATVPQEALMLTEDENIIDIEFAVQYDVKSATDMLFNVSESVEAVVRQATESAVRETVGHNSMDFAITEGRAQIAAETKTLVQQILDRYQTGVNIRSVEMQNAQPPSQVKDAFDDAVRAREDEVKQKNLAEAYANDILPRARGQAARIVEEAEAYKAATIAKAQGEAARFDQVREEYQKAPQVTRDRLYIDAMQSVLGNSSKLVMDQSAGGNSVMYLPIDKLIEKGTNSAPAASGSRTSVTPTATLPSSSSSGSSRPSRSTERRVSR